MKAFRLACLGVTPVLAALGCSLINSFDDLKPAVQDSGADSALADSTSGDTSNDEGVDTGTPDTGMPDTAVDVPVDTGPVDQGLIVLSAQHKPAGVLGQIVLAVLDPTTGNQLGTDEKITVPIVRYDGVRDLWYVFTNTRAGNPAPSFSLNDTDKVSLSIRQWNPTTKTFTVKKVLDNVPIPLADETTVVLRNRIAYVAQAPGDGGSTYSLVSIDTTDPSNPSVSTGMTSLTDPPIAALGTRATAPISGGTMNLLYQQNCAAADAGGQVCDLAIQKVVFPSSTASSPATSGSRTVIASMPTQVGGKPASPSWASYLNAGSPQDIFAYPPMTSGMKSTIIRLEPSSAMPVIGSSPISFGPSYPLIRPMAIAECAKAALVVDLLGQNLFAVPLSNDGSAMQAASSLGHPGQRIFWEPYTKTALTPFNQSTNFGIDAHTVGGTALAPTLAVRSSFTPPADLAPNTLATKLPVDFTCP